MSRWLCGSANEARSRILGPVALLFLLLLALLNFRPGIAKGHCAIENRRLRSEIDRIGAEVSQPLKLVLVPRLRFGQARLQTARLQDDQGFRVQIRPVVGSLE